VVFVIVGDRKAFDLADALPLQISTGIPAGARIVAAVDHQPRAVIACEQGARAVLYIENFEIHF
jgi:hypothetical protein